MIKSITSLIICLVLPLCFTSCLTTKDTNLLKEAHNPDYRNVESVSEYTLKPGDELRIMITVTPGNEQGNDATERLFSLFSARNNTSESAGNDIRNISVNPSGKIYFPYLGEIPVQGKTTLEVQKILEDRLTAEIIPGCYVRVLLSNRYFSVIGESRSGRYPIAKEQITIFQALAQSGDINPYGDRKNIKVLRQTEHGTVIKTFDLRSQDIINSEFYYIQPNDIIYIQSMSKQFWGIDSFGAIFAVVSTIASLGILIYSLIK